MMLISLWWSSTAIPGECALNSRAPASKPLACPGRSATFRLDRCLVRSRKPETNDCRTLCAAITSSLVP